MRLRRQLTLFLDIESSVSIEEFRSKFNPVQFSLIRAHVTLCRENEIEELEKVLQNINIINFKSLKINFGNAERFSDEKGLLIPALSSVNFNGLRKQILTGIVDNVQQRNAHITLMHPRNSLCSEKIFLASQTIQFPKILNFSKMSLIEQRDSEKWRIVKTY